jgi:hypothetical protein
LYIAFSLTEIVDWTFGIEFDTDIELLDRILVIFGIEERDSSKVVYIG